MVQVDKWSALYSGGSCQTAELRSDGDRDPGDCAANGLRYVQKATGCPGSAIYHRSDEMSSAKMRACVRFYAANVKARPRESLPSIVGSLCHILRGHCTPGCLLRAGTQLNGPM